MEVDIPKSVIDFALKRCEEIMTIHTSIKKINEAGFTSAKSKYELDAMEKEVEQLLTFVKFYSKHQ